jgi:uncharacterized membrane protein YphA (DoxX/SURF4 family)
MKTATLRPRVAVSWILQIPVAAMFLFSGTLKLIGDPMMVQLFDALGAGQWFRYVTGAMEVGAAVLLLVPSLAIFGALLLAATMVGAIVTHLFIVGGSPAIPMVLLAATIAIAWLRRDRFARSFGRDASPLSHAA